MPFIIPRWPIILLASIWWISTKLMPEKTDSLKEEFGNWIKKNQMVAIQGMIIIIIIFSLTGYDLRPYWANFFPSFIATLLGVFLATNIENFQSARKLEKEKKEKIQMAVLGIIKEIQTHKQALHSNTIDTGSGGVIYILQSIMFKGILYSDLFFNLPISTQYDLSNHYAGVDLLERFSSQTQMGLDRTKDMTNLNKEMSKEIDYIIEDLRLILAPNLKKRGEWARKRYMPS